MFAGKSHIIPCIYTFYDKKKAKSSFSLSPKFFFEYKLFIDHRLCIVFFRVLLFCRTKAAILPGPSCVSCAPQIHKSKSCSVLITWKKSNFLSCHALFTENYSPIFVKNILKNCKIAKRTLVVKTRTEDSWKSTHCSLREEKVEQFYVFLRQY